MKGKSIIATAVALSTAALFAVNALAQNDLALQAGQTMIDFQKADSSLKPFMDNAQGYAVFPSIGEGGVAVGGARGTGVLFENGVMTGRTTLTQGSVGAQAGGQSFSQIIIFQTPSVVSNFESGNFQMSADVKAVALSASGNQLVPPLTYTRGVAVVTMPRSGLVAQTTVGGQRFSFEPLLPTGR